MKLTPEKKLQMYTKRDSCDGRRWMHKDNKHIRVKRYQVSQFLREGWVEGRTIKKDILTGRFIK